MNATTTGHVREQDTGTSMLWAAGLAVLAASLLIVLGVIQFLEGLAAILNDAFLVSVHGYTYALDTTAWGWVHLGIGVIAVITGAFIFTGQAWARIVGIVLAGLSAVANFLFIPYYPFWAVVVVALNIAVIWALAIYDPRQL